MNYPKSTAQIVVLPRMRALRACQKLIAFVAFAMGLLLSSPLKAATPGISDTTFNLVAGPASITEPDGVSIYSWGYGCASTYSPTFLPPGMLAPYCPTMQVPGPTLILTEGTTYTVNLKNNLPAGAGNASIVFPGLQVVATCFQGATNCVQGLQTLEATPGNTVTYTVTATAPGTRAYYSGTQPDLQIEMGLYGATVVRPNTVPADCTALNNGDVGQSLGTGNLGFDFRLAPSAYDHPGTCYDREYLFQWMELDPVIHRQAEEQVQNIASCQSSPTPPPICPTLLDVKTEPWHPRYFMINGRSMPDNMDPDYAPNYPHQPYNGNPHMHPGDLTLVRTIGQGRWMHPFHEHGNHVRILARDGNLILSQNDIAPTAGLARLAGRMEFTTDTYPGQAYDGIFYWSGKGLGWDIFGHTPGTAGNPPCNPDVNGYYTKASGAKLTDHNYYEWCADHNHPLEANPVGQIGGGGPATTFDPLVATNGLWYNGTPYFGPDAVINNRGYTPLPPGSASQNPLLESGIAFMWHSHNEREITTNDVFPGGMLMMMLVDPPVWYINEAL
jgi:FtsP/CotA-like multicopper oxidase with cupredoxin domain